MHYAVPRILAKAGCLERLYTDFCAAKGWPRLLRGIPEALRPDLLKRAVSRRPEGVPRERILAFNDFGRQYARRVRSATGE